MKTRIEILLKKEILSPSKFADKINVQRSSISHILSGRNNPSLDFVQKVLSKFKTLNSDWLLFGKGEMYKTDQDNLFTETRKKKIPEPLHTEWVSRLKNGKVKLGLQDDYRLLIEFNDELGQRFHELALDNKEKSPLIIRNDSILAHGFQPVTKKGWDKLWESSLNLCNLNENELPKYSKDMCPRTLDLLSRCVAMGLSEWYTENDCRQVAGAINKVLSAYHEPIEGAAWHDIKA